MPEPLKLGNYLAFEEANGEIRLFGRRFALTDLMGLCRHLDSLVGEKIAATIAGQHGRETGKDDVAHVREDKPNATFREIIDSLTLGEVLGGYGVVKLTMNEDQAVPVTFEMRNPLTKASEGTGVRLILSYWAGALSALLDKTLDATDAFYNQSDDTLRCRFAVVGLTETT